MRLGLTIEDLKVIDFKNVIYYDDCHKHWYKIAICNELMYYTAKKIFTDNYGDKIVNEIWICFDEELTEFSQPMAMVRVEENKEFYYYPIMGDDLKIWIRDLVLPEINKINKLTDKEKQDYYLKNSPSNRKE